MNTYLMWLTFDIGEKNKRQEMIHLLPPQWYPIFSIFDVDVITLFFFILIIKKKTNIRSICKRM